MWTNLVHIAQQQRYAKAHNFFCRLLTDGLHCDACHPVSRQEPHDGQAKGGAQEADGVVHPGRDTVWKLIEFVSCYFFTTSSD